MTTLFPNSHDGERINSLGTCANWKFPSLQGNIRPDIKIKPFSDNIKHACMAILILASLKTQILSSCLDTRQPGNVFKKLDTWQSEILTNFLEMAH